MENFQNRWKEENSNDDIFHSEEEYEGEEEEEEIHKMPELSDNQNVQLKADELYAQQLRLQFIEEEEQEIRETLNVLTGILQEEKNQFDQIDLNSPYSDSEEQEFEEDDDNFEHENISNFKTFSSSPKKSDVKMKQQLQEEKDYKLAYQLQMEEMNSPLSPLEKFSRFEDENEEEEEEEEEEDEEYDVKDEELRPICIRNLEDPNDDTLYFYFPPTKDQPKGRLIGIKPNKKRNED